jgi:hypothetical protein
MLDFCLTAIESDYRGRHMQYWEMSLSTANSATKAMPQ